MKEMKDGTNKRKVITHLLNIAAIAFNIVYFTIVSQALILSTGYALFAYQIYGNFFHLSWLFSLKQFYLGLDFIFYF